MTFEKRRTLLMGVRGWVMPVPKLLSDRGLAKGVAGARAKAARLTADERRVHHFIVRAMATAKSPIEARMVSDALLLPHDMVLETIDKLEELKTFLYRSGGQGVDWAYPVSLDDTGHEMRCSTGERFNAA